MMMEKEGMKEPEADGLSSFMYGIVEWVSEIQVCTWSTVEIRSGNEYY